ncbi:MULTISPECIES: putative quinol monooxygenase [Acidocella]|uniref:putative quinol monooxygenase n=1 Tax=Acidocella TaxID=50709 RepID=UPI00054D71A5|nr:MULTISPECIES: antibiotic biosynthesis monooxygenase [Acidocella]WBO57797.1 antibiotic biosynthesis monooxygenase [Acidocella sp. MX-AZ03]
MTAASAPPLLSTLIILRAKPGRENAIREALLDLAELTGLQEPGTLQLSLVQDPHDAGLFALTARCRDEAALSAYHNSDPMNRFLFFARDLLDGPMIRVAGPELFALG